MSSVIFTHGIYNGRYVDDIVERDPGYIIWAHRHLPQVSISSDQLAKAVRLIDAQPTVENDFGYSSDFEDYRIAGGYVSDEE